MDQQQIVKNSVFAAKILKDFTYAFINCQKPLIACVQGPAIGVAFTMLGLCDLVYSTTNAKFYAPLVKLAQV